MRGSLAAACRITSAVPSVEPLSTRIASHGRSVRIAISESSMPRNCGARLRVQMTIDTSGLAELMHKPRDLIHRADQPHRLRALGPGLVEGRHLAVQRIEQQVPDAEQAA